MQQADGCSTTRGCGSSSKFKLMVHIHLMGVMDHIASAGKRKRKNRLFCSKCHKFNHNTADCWNNNIKRQKKTGSNSNNDEQKDEERA